MSQLTSSQIRKLDLLFDLKETPEKYGCRFDKGDPETYEERAGKIVRDAIGVLNDAIDDKERRFSSHKVWPWCLLRPTSGLSSDMVKQ